MCVLTTHSLIHSHIAHRYRQNYDHYVAHLIRGYHEMDSKKKLFVGLPVGEVIEVSDWKMKVGVYYWQHATHTYMHIHLLTVHDVGVSRNNA